MLASKLKNDEEIIRKSEQIRQTKNSKKSSKRSSNSSKKIKITKDIVFQEDNIAPLS